MRISFSRWNVKIKHCKSANERKQTFVHGFHIVFLLWQVSDGAHCGFDFTEEQAAIKAKYNLTGLSEEGFIVGEVGKDDFGAIKNK